MWWFLAHLRWYDDSHVESISCDAMLHRISCDNSLGHIMFDNPLDLSYAMRDIYLMSYLQSLRSDYAYAIKINPIWTYGIVDKPMVIGISFSCDDIDMLPLRHLCHMCKLVNFNGIWIVTMMKLQIWQMIDLMHSIRQVKRIVKHDVT